MKHLFIWLTLLLVLVWNREASAQNYILRYVDTASGAVTFTGNTLGLNKAAAANSPGTSGAIGAFITLNTNLNAGGGYPNGTTLNWSNNSSAAVLRMPTNSTVLYAELIWAGSAQVNNGDTSAAGDVLPYLNRSVQFILPNGSTNNIAPDPATATLATNGTTALFYCRSANVTALVQAAGTGTYSVGGVPATVLAAEASNNGGGWTLAVVYGNSALHQRNLSLFVGNYFVSTTAAAPPVGVQGFCAPSIGAVNAFMFVSAIEGDPQTVGDHMYFGPTNSAALTNVVNQLSGPNNVANNFFAGQINYCQSDNLLGTAITNGTLDTSGTFGLSNSIPGTGVSGARQGWDITCVNVSSNLSNGDTSAFVQGDTVGDGYSIDALALQIDVGSPVLTTSQTVDKASTFVGDTLTYTVTVTNSGTADAVNLIFTDPLPFGTSYIANTFKTNGVVIAGANPVNGVSVPIIKQNGSYTATYQVQVNQIPPAAKFITHATIDFQYAGACAQSPIINSTLVNANVQTLVPLLNVNKISSLTNALPGQTFTYTINVPNIGTTNTVNSALNDQIPVGTTYVPGTTTLNGAGISDIGVGGTNMPYTVTTEIHAPGRAAGVINVGDTAVITFQVKISPTFPSYINNTATIFVNTSAPTSSQSAAANIPPIISDLAVGIVGTPNPVAAGTNISYTISVTNRGPNSVNNATNFITLSLPLSQSILSPIYTPGSGTYNPLNGVWSGINLPSNGVVTMTVSGTVAPNTTASSISSSVTVIPPPGVVDVVTNNNTATATNTVVQVADLAVTISDGVTNVYQGEALTYTVTAVNLGPSTLTSLSVSNSLSTNDLVFIPSLFSNFTFTPDEGSYNLANGVWSGLNLTPGGSVKLTLQATVLNNVSGLFTNTVVVSVPSGVTDPVLANNTSADVDIILTAPDLGISKIGPANVFAGTNFNYTITITNSGFATASNVVVSDALPTGAVFVSASGNGTNNSGVVNWNLGNIAVNRGTNLTLTVTAFNDSITNVASVTASTPDSDLSNNTNPPVITTVTPLANLAIGKTGPASIIATSNFTYTISVTNFGPSIASGVVVTDALPPTVTFVLASGGGVNNGGVVNWDLGALDSGEVSNLTVTVTAPANGSLTNIARVSSITTDTNLFNNTNPPVITTVTPLAQTADVRMSKTAPTNVFAGTNFIYTITVTNVGPGFASNVVASDVLPTNVVFVSASSGGTTNAGVVSWTLGTFAINRTTNLTITVTAPASGTITNIATVTSTTTDPTPTNNTSPPVTTTVMPLADVAIGKSGSATVLALSNLTYTVSVTNLGPSTASGVVVTDGLPAGVIFVLASGGGVNNAGVVSWSLGSLTAGQTSNLTLTATAPAGGTLTNTAIVNSPTGDPNPTNNTSPPVTTTVTPVADLTIGKNGPAIISAASNLTYTISVTNFGPSTAGGVVVTDSLPAGATFVSASGGGVNNSGVVNWALGNLIAGQTSNLTLTVTAPASGTLTNVASVNSPTGDPNPTNNISPPVTTTVAPVADVGVRKSGPAAVFAGTNFNYTITVTNSGPSTASNVVASDVLPTNVVFVSASSGGTTNAGIATWSLGTLAANATTNLTLTVTAPAGGILTNTASVNSPGDPNPTNNTSPPVTTTVTPVADLAIGKSGPASVLAASNFTYNISITNLGPSTAGGVVVTDSLPVGVTFVSASGGGTTNAGIVNWSLGTLAVNATTNLTLTVTAPASGALTNTASVNSPTGDSNPTNNTSPPVTTTVIPSADVVVTEVGPTNVLAGGTIIYTVTVTNSGPSTAGNVVINDNLPTNSIFVSTTGGGTNNNGIVTWPTIPALTSGGTFTFTVTVTAPPTGPLTNTVSGSSPTGDPNPANNNGTSPSAIVITTVTPVADLAVFKTGPANVSAGGSITYTITVTNLGPSSVSGVMATDALPAAVTYANSTGGGSLSGGTVTWTLGALAGGTATNVTVTVTAPASGSFTNIAQAGSSTADPNPTNNNGTVPGSQVTTTVTPTPVADIGVTKTGPANVFAGTNFSYTITVTNSGPAAASNVVASDVLPTNVVFVSASGGGTTNAGVASWPVGTLAAGGTTNLTLTVTAPAGGTITNVATVTSATADPNPGNNTSIPVGTTVTSVSDLAVGKSGPAGSFLGANFSYTITVTNFGPSTATALSVTDSLPAGLVFVSSLPSTTTNAGNQVIWTGLGNLAAGATTNLTLNVTATLRTGVTNYASVGSPAFDPSTANNTSTPVVTTITNRPPVAVNDTATTQVGVPVTIPVLSNDSDPDGDALTIVGVSPTNGTAIISGTNVVFTPPANLTGTVRYTITDGFGGTNFALITISVTNPTPSADVQIVVLGPPVVTAGDGFSYTNIVFNAGPSTAVSLSVTDSLPAGLVFASASGGGVVSNNVVTWPVIASLANGQSTNLIVTVTSSTNGSAIFIQTNNPNPFNFVETNTPSTFNSLTNVASAFAATFDPNLTNNSASTAYTNAQVQTQIVPGIFSIFIATNTYATNLLTYALTNTVTPIGASLFIVGTSAFNPQTGLFEESVTVTNIGAVVVHALRIYIGGLPSSVTIYNATGTNNGVPYVEYDPPYNSPLTNNPPGNFVTFLLEFYEAVPLPFTNSLTAVAINPPVAAPITGTIINITTNFVDYRFTNSIPGDLRYVIVFNNSIPGRTYTIEYSTDMVTWSIAVPSIVASANATQWYDDGPPETVSKPFTPSTPRRYYRVLLDP